MRPAVPVRRHPHTLGELDARFEAELAPRLLDRVPVVRSEQLHAEPRDDRLARRAGQLRDALGDVAGGVERAIRNVAVRTARADLVGDRSEELLLCERAVV